MFPPLYTHYYWEEKREEIYRSAPTRTRVVRGRRGTSGHRGARRREGRRTEAAAECLSHGPAWTGHFGQLTDGLCGTVLPDRPGLRDELAATVCTCDGRNKEKCREAAARFGFTTESNLPVYELNKRMRFTELYFHNILNSPQFREEYLGNAANGSGEAEDGDGSLLQTVRGLYAARAAVFALVQRCVLGNDLCAYRLLDVVRLYIQKPCRGRLLLPLPACEQAALEVLFTLEKGDHLGVAARAFGCRISLALSPGIANDGTSALELQLRAANVNDIKAVGEYLENPIGFKEPPPKPEAAAAAGEGQEVATNGGTSEETNAESATQAVAETNSSSGSVPNEPSDSQASSQDTASSSVEAGNEGPDNSVGEVSMDQVSEGVSENQATDSHLAEEEASTPTEGNVLTSSTTESSAVPTAETSSAAIEAAHQSSSHPMDAAQVGSDSNLLDVPQGGASQVTAAPLSEVLMSLPDVPLEDPLGAGPQEGSVSGIHGAASSNGGEAEGQAATDRVDETAVQIDSSSVDRGDVQRPTDRSQLLLAH